MLDFNTRFSDTMDGLGFILAHFLSIAQPARISVAW